jgi:hypothetical protein
LTLSFFANPSPKYGIKSVLNIIRYPALESLTIAKFDGWYIVNDISSLQTLPLPPFPFLQSLELCRCFGSEFVIPFDFTHLPTLDTISLTRCTDPWVSYTLCFRPKENTTAMMCGRPSGSSLSWS